MHYVVRRGAAVRAFADGPFLAEGEVVELDAETAARLEGQIDPAPAPQAPAEPAAV